MKNEAISFYSISSSFISSILFRACCCSGQVELHVKVRNNTNHKLKNCIISIHYGEYNKEVNQFLGRSEFQFFP